MKFFYYSIILKIRREFITITISYRNEEIIISLTVIWARIIS